MKSDLTKLLGSSVSFCRHILNGGFVDWSNFLHILKFEIRLLQVFRLLPLRKKIQQLEKSALSLGQSCQVSLAGSKKSSQFTSQLIVWQPCQILLASHTARCCCFFAQDRHFWHNNFSSQLIWIAIAIPAVDLV